ncbi:MAG: hypothetical protein Q9201_002899 [Fulgogasparrea decipioides]
MRSESDFLLAQFFRDQGFLRLQPPIITSSDCEGAGEVFSVGSKAPVPTPRAASESRQETLEGLFFRKPKFLTVSSQLHLEAYMQEHSKVWTFSPTFRAERSDTPRHVSEFWMLEAEMRTHSLEIIMDLVEDMIKSLVQGFGKSTFMEELVAAKRTWEQGATQELTDSCEGISSRWEGLQKGSWPRITYTAAMRLLQDSVSSGKSNFVHEPDAHTGLQLEHEKYIAAHVGLGQPVFVTDYPKAVKPFYMLPSATDGSHYDLVPKTAACFDLLFPEVCEVVGGSLREHRLPQLEASMPDRDTSSNSESAIQCPEKKAGVPTTTAAGAGNLDWYMDLRRFGSVPHGGFGLGFDRLLCYLVGMRSIKDVIPWPRYYGRCDC